MPDYDFDAGTEKSKYDFDAMDDDAFNALMATIPEAEKLKSLLATLAADAEDERRLRSLVVKGIEAGWKVAKGGGSVALLGLV